MARNASVDERSTGAKGGLAPSQREFGACSRECLTRFAAARFHAAAIDRPDWSAFYPDGSSATFCPGKRSEMDRPSARSARLVASGSDASRSMVGALSLPERLAIRPRANPPSGNGVSRFGYLSGSRLRFRPCSKVSNSLADCELARLAQTQTVPRQEGCKKIKMPCRGRDDCFRRVRHSCEQPSCTQIDLRRIAEKPYGQRLFRLASVPECRDDERRRNSFPV
jgi:hypothetical protein